MLQASTSTTTCSELQPNKASNQQHLSYNIIFLSSCLIRNRQELMSTTVCLQVSILTDNVMSSCLTRNRQELMSTTVCLQVSILTDNVMFVDVVSHCSPLMSAHEYLIRSIKRHTRILLFNHFIGYLHNRNSVEHIIAESALFI